MAIVLDINYLCNRMIGIDIIEQILRDYHVNITSIHSIDNWMWNNERIVELQELERVLNDNRIFIIKLQQMLVKDLGLYIEKVEDIYHYTLWINTEGYSMLDCDEINEKNEKYYEKIFQTIIRTNEKIKDGFDVVGIGLETDIYYSKNALGIIQNSQNIMIWMLNKHIELSNEMMIGYKIKCIEGVNILEKSDNL